MGCRNSEIYNHEEVKAQHLQDVRIVKDSKSDSAIIGHLYQVQRPTLPQYSTMRQVIRFVSSHHNL